MIPKIQKILYATDLSLNSVYALRYAMNSALKHNADIIILHVFEKVDPGAIVMLDLYLYDKKHQEILNEHIAEAKAIIKNRLRSLLDKELYDHPEFEDNVISIEVCGVSRQRKFLARRMS